MDHHHQFGGSGNWSMIPNIQSSHSNPATPSNQDNNLFIQQQFNQQQFNQHPRFQQQQQQIQQIQQQQPQQLQQQSQSLASHFNLQNLVEKLAQVSENGTRDQHADSLIGGLNSQFEKCQQLLNSIGMTIKVKSATVDEQKRRLEETENQLNQRRDLMLKYRNSVEDLISPQV